MDSTTYELGSKAKEIVYKRDKQRCRYCGIKNKNRRQFKILPADPKVPYWHHRNFLTCKSCAKLKSNMAWTPRQLDAKGKLNKYQVLTKCGHLHKESAKELLEIL